MIRDLKGFGALRLKLYLELSFRILNKILCFNFKLHFEPEATKSLTPDPWTPPTPGPLQLP